MTETDVVTPGTYRPSLTDTRIFGLDISSNQGLINFGKMLRATPTPRFVACRTGISWGYKDKLFRLYWETLGELFIPRVPYHVLYPLEKIADQVKNFLSIFPDKDFGEGFIVNDCELVHGATKRQLSNACEAFNKALEDATGKEVVVYSRFTFLQAYMEYQSWMEHSRWWMANYIDGEKYPPIREWPGAPSVPSGYERLPVIILQTGCKGDGPYYGTTVECKQIDTNRWLLDEVEFNRTFSGFAPAPEPEPSIEEKVRILWEDYLARKRVYLPVIGKGW